MSIGLPLRPQRLSLRLSRLSLRLSRLSLRLPRASDQQSWNRVDQHLGVWLLR